MEDGVVVDDSMVAEAVAALEAHTLPHPAAHPDALDPAFLTYGSRIVLRPSVSPAGRLKAGPGGGVDVDIHGIGHEWEAFVIRNSLHPSDTGTVLFSDSVCLQSVVTGHYLCVESATGRPRMRHAYDALYADKWTLTPASVPASSRTGSGSDLEVVLAGVVAPSKGALRSCAPVCLRSPMGRFLGVDTEVKPFPGVLAPMQQVAGAGDLNAHPALVWHMTPVQSPYTAPWALDRKLLTGQAALGGAAERRASPDALTPLSSYPVAVQEEILVQDLLDAFLGVDGRYIVSSLGSASAAPSAALQGPSVSSVSFVLDGSGRGVAAGVGTHDVDVSLAYLVQRLLPLATHYVRCAWFIERRSRAESGLTAQALAAAARVYLQEHALVVLQLEDRARGRRRLTLQEVWFHVQATLRTMSALDTVVHAAPHAVGGQLLSSLHGFRHHPELRTVALFLLESSAAPMLHMLEKWIFEGVIDDPHGEFMVHSREDLAKEALNQDYNAVYWDERYTVRKRQVPAFLEPHADAILTTGKYLNAIRLCGMPIDCPFAAAIPFGSDERDYAPIVQRAYRFSTAMLLDHLLGEAKLMQRLTCLKNYFFLQQADFLTHFMDLADSELKKEVATGAPSGGGAGGPPDVGVATSEPHSGISLQRLRSLLELSLRSSVAVSDPFLDDLSCALERAALIDHLEAIHNPDGVGAVTSGSMTGYNVFTMDYAVRWPLSIVLSKRSLTKYQLIFRHLFWCKYVERELCGAWMHQTRRERGSRPRVSVSMTHALRHRMLHFMQNLIYYMTFEVLQPRWAEMMDNLRKASTIDDVLRVHDETLDTCLKECLLTSHTLVKVLTQLTTLCLYFAAHLRKLDHSVATPEDQTTLQGMIERSSRVFSTSLRDFLSQLMDASKYRSHTLSLCARLDFNDFYSKELGLVKAPL